MRRIRVLAADMHAAYERPLKDWITSKDLPTYAKQWITSDRLDHYWRSLEPHPELDRIVVPCLHLGGWYDIFLGSTLKTFEALSMAAGADLARRQFLAVGPWQHVPWSRLNGAIDHGEQGDNRAAELQLAWFDHWLKEKALGREDRRVRYFLLGANRWEDGKSWPPNDSRPFDLYLHSTGSAGRRLTDGSLTPEVPADEPPDIYVYDPSEPVPSVGGASCCRPDIAPVGAFDQRQVESRSDVLVYTTPVLGGDCDVVGPVVLTLQAATDARDTDWTAKLVDVYPDGTAINVCDGILRARYSNSLVEPSLVEQGAVIEYRIELGSTAMRFAAGHAIRLEVSSSNFPTFDINLNLEESNYLADPLDGVVATQVVVHNRMHASRLTLMVRGQVPVFRGAQQ